LIVAPFTELDFTGKDSAFGAKIANASFGVKNGGDYGGRDRKNQIEGRERQRKLGVRIEIAFLKKEADETQLAPGQEERQGEEKAETDIATKS